MRGTLGAFIQSCLILLVRADQWRLKDAADCELHRKQTDLNSFLWMIKRDPPSYFYGTIHVPYTRVWDFIPENSKQAFQESNIVYFELDLTDPYTIAALNNCQMLPQGEKLQDLLPRDIFRRLKRHLEYVKLMMSSWMTPDQRGKGLYADYLFNAIAGNWEKKRPVWVMLMVNSLTEADIKTRGVPVLDLYLAQEAERMKKRTGAVEKVEEQCHPLNGLNFSQVPNFKNVTLPPSERLTAQEIDRYFRQELIYKRNERMGNRVKALLEEHPDKSFFFAFGAGHFLGNNTVIDVLRRQGYEVVHTPAGQPINRRSSTRLAPPESDDPHDESLLLEPFLHELPHKEDDHGLPLEDHLLPHMLLPPDSLELLEKAERKMLKKRRRNKQKKQRHRHFNDLWVRMEESTNVQSPPPPLVRIINGYITVQPHNRVHNQYNHHHKSSATSLSCCPSSFIFLCIWLAVQMWNLTLQ
ncbi:metalloprotease TIKI1 isoform X2 [Antennarius striatus]|uniref:metalloprotease TIKI1 isoform X2 n=1 Tax=Antennarius striatus TaxID=241820 RepID=UPI0035B4DD3B